MIDSLHGEVLHIGLDHVVIECGGVGYRATAAPSLLSTLRRGEQARILTTLVVREDSMSLFAFESADARDMFALVQTVSGVGPRLAMAAIAVHKPEQLAQAIVSGDLKTLQKIPGVGKRVAERMIVDLKTKVDKYVPAPSADGSSTADATPLDATDEPVGVVATVSEALVGLGFPESQAVKTATRAAKEGGTTSEILRRALSSMSS